MKTTSCRLSRSSLMNLKPLDLLSLCRHSNRSYNDAKAKLVDYAACERSNEVSR